MPRTNLEEYIESISLDDFISKVGIGEARRVFQKNDFLSNFMEKRFEFFHRRYASCQLAQYIENPSCPNHINDGKDFDINCANKNCDFCKYFINDFLPSLNKNWMENQNRGIFYAEEGREHRPNFQNFDKWEFHGKNDSLSGGWEVAKLFYPFSLNQSKGIYDTDISLKLNLIKFHPAFQDVVDGTVKAILEIRNEDAHDSKKMSKKKKQDFITLLIQFLRRVEMKWKENGDDGVLFKYICTPYNENPQIQKYCKNVKMGKSCRKDCIFLHNGQPNQKSDYTYSYQSYDLEETVEKLKKLKENDIFLNQEFSSLQFGLSSLSPPSEYFQEEVGQKEIGQGIVEEKEQQPEDKKREELGIRNAYNNDKDNNNVQNVTNNISLIYEKLQRNPLLIITGLGGIGKTTTMLEYTKRYKSKYDSIVVINECDLESNFYSNLRLLVRKYFSGESNQDDEELKKKKNEEIQKIVLENLKQKTYGNLLLIFDNVDTDESIAYIKPFVNELHAYNYAHIIITTRIQGTKSFSQHLLPDEQNDAVDISMCMYPLRKLSFFASWSFMQKKLKLDKNEILELTKGSSKSKNKLKELLNIMDGLPLALNFASRILSDDLAKVRLKEGKITGTSMNQVFQDYLQKYHTNHELFDTEENEYQHDIKISFDEALFHKTFYEQHVKTNPRFRFLEQKLGVKDLDDYQCIREFSADEFKEGNVTPLERKHLQKLWKEEEEELQKVKEQQDEERREVIKERMKYRRCIATTWKINYDRLSDEAKKVLQVCSFLPSEMIMQSLLCSEGAFNTTIWQELENSSLLSPLIKSKSNSYYHHTCHRLVQEFAQKRILPNNFNNLVTELIAAFLEGYSHLSKDELHQDHDLAKNIFLQFQSICASGIFINPEQDEKFLKFQLKIMQKAATHAWDYLYDASSAMKILKSSRMQNYLNNDIQIQSNGHSDIADSLYCIGMIYAQTGDFNEALVYYNKALKISDRVFGVEDAQVEKQCNIRIAAILQQIGTVYGRKQSFDEALAYYHKALKIRYREFDVDEAHVETKGTIEIANLWNNIGNIYKSNGQYDKALENYKKALKIKCRVNGVDESHVESKGNSSIAASLHNIGMVYGIKGNFGEALAYFHKALKIQYRVFGVSEADVENKGNSSIADSLNNIGKLYRSKEQYDEALVYYQKALKIQYRVFGVDETHVETQGNSDIAIAFNNFGDVYKAKEQYDKALEYYQKALKIYYRVFGVKDEQVETQGNSSIADLLYQIGIVCKAKEQYGEALKYFQKTLKIRKRVFQNNLNHHDIQIVEDKIKELTEKFDSQWKGFYEMLASTEVPGPDKTHSTIYSAAIETVGQKRKSPDSCPSFEISQDEAEENETKKKQKN